MNQAVNPAPALVFTVNTVALQLTRNNSLMFIGDNGHSVAQNSQTYMGVSAIFHAVDGLIDGRFMEKYWVDSFVRFDPGTVIYVTGERLDICLTMLNLTRTDYRSLYGGRRPLVHHFQSRDRDRSRPRLRERSSSTVTASLYSSAHRECGYSPTRPKATMLYHHPRLYSPTTPCQRRSIFIRKTGCTNVVFRRYTGQRPQRCQSVAERL